MNLGEFERVGGKRRGRFVTRVQDLSSDEQFELTVAGPPNLVEEVLGDATIELVIDSAQSEDDIKRKYDEQRAEQRKAMWSLGGLEDLDELFKPEAPAPRPDTSVVAAVRPVSGEGTPFAITFSSFAVPARVTLSFIGSFVVFTMGALVPATGDQDLLIRLFSPTGPVLSSSSNPRTALDVAWFTMPLPFVPVYQVFGFTAGTCASFAAHGG